MNVLGIKITGHDTGAALISSGKVIAISEERLNRIKYSPEIFPKLSIDYCLREFKLRPEDIDLVVYDPTGVDELGEFGSEIEVQDSLGKSFRKARIERVNHHNAHAATAFFCSPFNEAAVMVYDGSGGLFKTHLGVAAAESETLYYGKNNSLTEIDKTLHARIAPGRYPYTIGIGKLYALISMSYLSFGRYNEGKMMGLSSYGDDSFLREFPYERWVASRAGQLVCNSKVVFKRGNAIERLKNANLKRAIRIIYEAILFRFRKIIGTLVSSVLRSGRGGMFVEPDIFEPVIMPRPARDPKRDQLPDKYYSSVAYAAQKIFEQFATEIGKRLQMITRSENICLAGGCGLNIDANFNFLEKAGFKKIFVQPASSDSGIPLGCALWGYQVILKQPRFWEMKNASLGRSYSEEEILAAIKNKEDEVKWSKSKNVCSEAAKLVADGNIVAWFQGGGEYGPRALGNRSIVCDARLPEMKDVLNKRVKHREMWRPFAASVLLEHMSEWFEIEEASPFMLLASLVQSEKRKEVPSIVHVDGTCRIQSLTAEDNGKYYELVKEFEKLTGVPLVLNTSFNLGGDPIVESPIDALHTFLSTDMDYLVIEDFIVSKKTS
ncbi:MAG: carbamoyltransferase C-terminal domain-containing protein [bacterium]|nr:carbamoyltransferase C-terminal domain-containing protein [bacterium]